MTFAPFKGSSFAVGERLLSSQVNQLNTDIPFALDGRDGGEYTPSAPLEIRGESALKADEPDEPDDVATKEYVDASVDAVDDDVAQHTIDIGIIRRASALQARVIASSLANGAYFDINNIEFATGPYAWNVSTIGGGGHEVTLPTAASLALRGMFWVEVQMLLQCSGTSNPQHAQVNLVRYDSSGPTETQLKVMNATRWTASASDLFQLNGGALVDMTSLTPALSTLRLQNVSGGGLALDTVGTVSKISIFRIGDGDP